MIQTGKVFLPSGFGIKLARSNVSAVLNVEPNLNPTGTWPMRRIIYLNGWGVAVSSVADCFNRSAISAACND
jgi:hypothetical protein